MDSIEDAREYNRMNNHSVNRDFVDHYLQFLASSGKTLGPLDDGEVDSGDDSMTNAENRIADILDVGTGTALIPIELCRRSEEIRVMAIDMAVSMLDLAIYNLDIAGYRERIHLGQVDAKDTEFDDEMFDSVICNSLLHHIPQPELTLAEIKRITRTGGAIFVRDLMRPTSSNAVDDLVKNYTAEENDRTQQLFKDSLHAALSLDEVKAMVAELGYEPNTVNATSDRHWTWSTVR